MTGRRLLILVSLLVFTVGMFATAFATASRPNLQKEMIARKEPGGPASAMLEEFRSRREAAEWPPFTMVYELEQGQAVMVGDRLVDPRQERRLEYESPTQWKVTVIESAPIETRVGTFSKAGSYHSLDGRKYTEFDLLPDLSANPTVEKESFPVEDGFKVALEPLAHFRVLGED